MIGKSLLREGIPSSTFCYEKSELLPQIDSSRVYKENYYISALYRENFIIIDINNCACD